MEPLVWSDENTFRVGDVTFLLSITERFTSTPDRFLLVKHRHMIDRYVDLLARLRPSRIVEIGILEGGSAAFLALINPPERFVAIDLKPEPSRGLEVFIDRHDLRGRVHTHYAIDQGDRDRVRALIDDEFGAEPLDLVIDDASHLLGPTRSSFNELFPRLRPGGVFVIEDWSGSHHYEAALESKIRDDPEVLAALEARIRSGAEIATPLTVLLFELVMASAFHPAVFAEVFVSDDWAYVVRGPGAIDPTNFDVSAAYGASAGKLLAVRD